MGFTNIHTFAKEKLASFRLPLNVTWLYKFDWSLIGEIPAAYVESFQLFLPNKEYKTGSEKVKTSTCNCGRNRGRQLHICKQEFLRTIQAAIEIQTSYVTVYQEGYQSSTYSKEIPNPYSLCNNPPKKCHTSTNVAGNSLLPTTLSRWRVTFKVQS